MAPLRAIARVFSIAALVCSALVCSALVCSTLHAQEYRIRYFGTAEGLTNLAVRNIFQDRAGFIWVSTENGIFRYDGERFEAYGPAQGLPSTSGAAFGEAPDGTLLAGGDFGLYHLSGNRFEHVALNGSGVSWGQGIQASGPNKTFIGTNAGLAELSPDPGTAKFKVRYIPRVRGTSGPEAYGIYVEGETVWYGCGLEICRRQGNEAAVFGRESGLPAHEWLAIQRDLNGNLWVRGKNAGVFLLMRGESRFRRPNSPFPAGALGGIPGMDKDGRMLLPAPDGLLIGGENAWQKVGPAAGLRGTVYAVLEDRQHSLWIGLAGRGLAHWEGYGEWESYTTESGLASDLVYEILPMADHSLWVATEGGLLRGTRNQTGGIRWAKVARVGDIPVHSVRMAPSGDIWIGTETRGVARIKPGTGVVEWFGDNEGLTGRAAYTLRFDRENRLWAATEAGLFVANAPYSRFQPVPGLPVSRFWAFTETRGGRLWAGGVDGLFGYADGQWKRYTAKDGLSATEVISLGAGPDDALWIGYRHGGGIDRVRPGAGPARGGIAIERAVQRHGSDGIAYFIEPDVSGRIWVGTERGVDVWDGSRWVHYDAQDGLVWDDCDLNAFAAEANGTVWIGTSGGLSRFTPRPGPGPELRPRVVFTKLLLGRKDVSSQPGASADIGSNEFTARYTALNVLRESSVMFRYRLLPASSAWTETRERTLQFAALSPGAYRLDVEARDSDGPWSGDGAGFSVAITPPWYRTWWSIAAGTLTPLVIIAVVFRLRILGARKRELDLLRVVEEKTVDLRRANEDLLRLSSLDPLTGLANRRIFDQKLGLECARGRKSETPVSLVLLDVDHFKALNDSEGHQRGDEYLVAVGSALRRLITGHGAVAARYGGEEFACVLPETDSTTATRFAESVCHAITALQLPHRASPVAPFLTVSVGVATARRGQRETPAEMLVAADQALYRAKSGGRNRVETAERESTIVTIGDD